MYDQFKHTSVSEAKAYISAHGHLAAEQNSNIVAFQQALTSCMRGVKTLYRTPSSSYLYFEGEYMTLGWIGYADFQTSKSGVHKYGVMSRHIQNNKYRADTDNHYISMSKNMDVGLKAAMGMLRSYSPEEIANCLRSTVREPVDDLVRNAYTKHREACKVLGLEYYGTEAARTMDALSGLLTIGHIFPQPEFHSDLLAYYSSKKETDRLSKPALPMVFVNVFKQWGKTHVSEVSISDIKSRYSGHTEHVDTYDIDKVPERLEDKIAVMSMMEDKSFVEDVGYKVDSTAFYFYTEEDNV